MPQRRRGEIYHKDITSEGRKDISRRDAGAQRGRAKARPYRVWEWAGVVAGGLIGSAVQGLRQWAGVVAGGGGHQAKEMGGPVRLLPYQARAVAMTVSSWAPGGAL